MKEEEVKQNQSPPSELEKQLKNEWRLKDLLQTMVDNLQKEIKYVMFRLREIG